MRIAAGFLEDLDDQQRDVVQARRQAGEPPNVPPDFLDQALSRVRSVSYTIRK